MTGKILDVSYSGAELGAGRQESVGALADALTLDNPLRDEDLLATLFTSNAQRTAMSGQRNSSPFSTRP